MRQKEVDEQGSGRVVPGADNAITDVEGILVGSAADPVARTGVTVILPTRKATGAVDVRGGAPGTIETDALNLTGSIDQVDAVVLSGGSLFGLDAASAVKNLLAARGMGLTFVGKTVPIVPAAILFDLNNGGDKEWGEHPPYRKLGRAALDSACGEVRMGNHGAGMGAVAGRLKGGLGTASAVCPVTGLTVGALVAVNSVGEVCFPQGGPFFAWYLEQAGEMGGQTPPTGPIALEPRTKLDPRPGENTTIGVVATDAPMTKVQAKRVAMMAHDGLAAAIRPIHTPFDGDTVFALATGAREVVVDDYVLTRIGALAADCTARAVARAVYNAKAVGSMPAWRDQAGRGAAA